MVDDTQGVILGGIEPHKELLKVPPDDQLLYKVMSLKNLIRSIEGSYLHFNRVNSYKDDPLDGEQTRRDKEVNKKALFSSTPEFSLADYYDRCRERTYACCFSLENSDYIWRNYGGSSEEGKVCFVFRFSKLKQVINSTLCQKGDILLVNGIACRQIFDLNYGLVKYEEWGNICVNDEYYANPIQYIFLKDAEKYSEERELRVSLSAQGMRHYVLNDDTEIVFPKSLSLGFDFRMAFKNRLIKQILIETEDDLPFLTKEMERLGVCVSDVI